MKVKMVKLVNRVNALRNSKVAAVNDETIENILATIVKICETKREDLTVEINSKEYEIDKFEVPEQFRPLLYPRFIGYDSSRNARDLRESNQYEPVSEATVLNPVQLKEACILLLNAFGRFDEPQWIKVAEEAGTATLHDYEDRITVDGCYKMTTSGVHGWPIPVQKEYMDVLFKYSPFVDEVEIYEDKLVSDFIRSLKVKTSTNSKDNN